MFNPFSNNCCIISGRQIRQHRFAQLCGQTCATGTYKRPPPQSQPDTSISEATCELLQPHWGELQLPPMVALRTCKSDTIAGLPSGLAEQVEAWEREQGRSAQGWEWMTDGRYAMVQLLGSR